MTRTRPAARWRETPAVPTTALDGLMQEMHPLWEAAGRTPPPEALFRLLAVRGHTGVASARPFLSPKLDALTPPELLTDLVRAAERLVQAIRARETILVHGDYDVDGMCSTALLTRVLRGVGGMVEPFIPDRKTDGYDLGPAGVRRAQAVGARVVLTCDCGTTALQPAQDLAAAGIDLIITDHHRLAASLPVCYALVNPQREPDVDVRGDRHLAAVGVAWKLASVVTDLLGGDPALLDDLLELVALATVADVAPLVGDNRVLVAEGLRRMTTPRDTGGVAPRNPGLRALCRSASLEPERINAGRLGFIVAPRLNALGRVRHALLGVQLLLADDESTAMDLAARCNEANAERQGLDRAILDEVRGRLGVLDLDHARGLVLDGDGWEPGVIGIVASRVVEITHRPTFMIAVSTEGGVRVGKGSGRSIPGFDLHAALTSCGDLLQKYGGHRAAAGLTIDAARIPEFAERFDAAARMQLRPEDLVPELRPDLELPIDDADERLLGALRHLEPFGIGNPGPVFVSRGVPVRGTARRIAADGLKLAFATPRGPQEGVGWGMADRAPEIPRDATLDVVYRLDANIYRGTRTLQANLLDFRVR